MRSTASTTTRTEVLGLLGHLVPARVVGRLELLDGDVAERRPGRTRRCPSSTVTSSPSRSASGRRRLPRPAHRAAPDRVDLLVGEPLGQRGAPGACPSVGERRIGGTLDGPLVDAHRERVADEQQLHGSSVLACAAVADLFVAEHPGPPGAPRVVLVHGSLDRSTAFLRVARELARPHGAPLRPARLRQVAGRRAAPRRSTTRWTTSRRWWATSRRSSSATASAAWWRSRSPSRHPELAPAVVAYEAPMPWLPSWPSNTAGGVGAGRVRRRGRRGRALHAPHRRRRPVGGAAAAHQGAAPRRRARPGRRAPLAAPAAPARPTTSPTFPVPVVAGHGGESRPHHQEAARTLADRGAARRAGGDRRRVARRPPQPPDASSPTSSGARRRWRDRRRQLEVGIAERHRRRPGRRSGTRTCSAHALSGARFT